MIFLHALLADKNKQIEKTLTLTCTRSIFICRTSSGRRQAIFIEFMHQKLVHAVGLVRRYRVPNDNRDDNECRVASVEKKNE